MTTRKNIITNGHNKKLILKFIGSYIAKED